MKLTSVCPFVSVVLTPILTLSPLCGQTLTSSASSPTGNPAAAEALQLQLDRNSSQAPAGSETVKGFTVRVNDSKGAAVPDVAIVFRLPDSGATGAFADGTHAAVAYTDSTGRAIIPAIRWAQTPGLSTMRITATKGTAHAGMLIEQTLTANNPVATTPLSQTPAPSAASLQTVPPEPARPASAETIAKTIVEVPPSAPVVRPLAAQAPGAEAQPSVSVSSPSPGQAPHSSHAKWFIIAAIAAGAGMGVAMAGKGKGSSSSSAPSLTIGAPSISVGQPPH